VSVSVQLLGKSDVRDIHESVLQLRERRIQRVRDIQELCKSPDDSCGMGEIAETRLTVYHLFQFYFFPKALYTLRYQKRMYEARGRVSGVIANYD
jgi:hypothetical protein